MEEDLFDRIGNNLILDKSSLLSKLDDYSIFCYYIEQVFPNIDLIVGDNIRSPLREDDSNPSFRIYERDDKLLFTDYGNKNQTGDVIKFVQLLFGISHRDAIQRIAADFGYRESRDKALPVAPVLKRVIKPKKEMTIVTKPFTQEGLAFWNKFHITELTLNRYNVFEVDWVFWDDVPMKPKQLAFGYRIGKYWKLYTPSDKEHKFVSYFPVNYVEGYMQLAYKRPLLIITKSTKDVMVLHEMGYEAISPQSESVVISQKLLTQLESKYKDIIILFDNDNKHNGDLYPYHRIEIPVKYAKDISDLARDYGFLKARSILQSLLQ